MQRLKIILKYRFLYIIILLLSLMYSFIRINIIKYDSKYSLNDNKIVGTLINIKEDNNFHTLTIKGKEKVIGHFKTKTKLNLKLGQKLELTGNLKLPKNNTIPNSFNYKLYLNNHHIYYILDIKELTIIDNKINIIYIIKNKLYERINHFNLTKDYIKTFILGDKSTLDEISVYQNNGISHLFAISGMHISLIVVILSFLLKKIKYKNIIIIIILIIYSQITLFAASIFRSLIFYILSVINKFYDLQITNKNILLLTVSLLIIYDPLIIFDLGFEYSVIVTYGIIISSKYYKKNYLVNLLITSLIALLFSLPITLINNYEINILSIINNLICVPLISFIIFPLSFIILIFSFLEPILYIFIIILENINIISNYINLKIIIPKVHFLFYIIYYLFIILFIKSNNHKYLFFNIIMLLFLKLKPIINNNYYVYFLDVGQGDSALICHKTETILIDTGGAFKGNVSDNTIKLIKSLGYSHIDLLILTHGDSDHMKDAINVTKHLNVKNVIMNQNEYNELEKNYLTLKQNLVKEYKSYLNLEIYNNIVGQEENSSSVITYLNINNLKFLFMGDAPKSEEILFLQNNKKADVIKLGHHGSKTSSDLEFLKQTNPKNAIISSGLNNIYNLPSKETIDNLKKLNIKYYNTSSSGTILYKIGQKNYTIKTYKP